MLQLCLMRDDYYVCFLFFVRGFSCMYYDTINLHHTVCVHHCNPKLDCIHDESILYHFHKIFSSTVNFNCVFVINLSFVNLFQMAHFISRIFFLEIGFSLNVPWAWNVCVNLYHHISFIIFYGFILFWRECMAYSKRCLNDKLMYHSDLWIDFLPEPNHLVFWLS